MKGPAERPEVPADLRKSARVQRSGFVAAMALKTPELRPTAGQWTIAENGEDVDHDKIKVTLWHRRTALWSGIPR
jgi:hypothetical protein